MGQDFTRRLSEWLDRSANQGAVRKETAKVTCIHAPHEHVHTLYIGPDDNEADDVVVTYRFRTVCTTGATSGKEYVLVVRRNARQGAILRIDNQLGGEPVAPALVEVEEPRAPGVEAEDTHDVR
jgi:hypothetical protein